MREAVVRIGSWLGETTTLLSQRANRRIRHAIGLTQDPPAPCLDEHEAYFPVDGVARLVHGDLSSMLVGGLGSLFLQMLHPHAMAGVAQHSRYQNDPLGRLLQTANFIGHTTYGSKPTAYADIERVLAVHQRVRGVADDGVAYDANDPHLLAWVHACEVSMFLAAYRRYGAVKISNVDADTYVREMATLAKDLGAQTAPTSLHELNEVLEAYRPELRLSADGVAARDFIAHRIVEGRVQRVILHLLMKSSFDLMPPWARELLGVSVNPFAQRMLTGPLTSLLATAIRRVIPPVPPHVDRPSPPSTATT